MSKDKSSKGDEKKEEGHYIFTMYITVKGKRVRRPNGRPFRILVKD